MALFAERMAGLGTENAFKLGDDIARCLSRGMDVIRLNIGEPDFDSAPHINEVAIEQIRSGNSHYTDPQGILPLRTAIAKHVSKTRGIDVDPGRVVVTPGGKPSIGFTIQTYVNPGEEVIYPSPGFPIYESWVTYTGAKAVPLHLREETGFTFTPEDLASVITPKTKVIFLCSPSNPTGGVLTREEIAGIARVIREKCSPDVRIYSDEIYEHILFDGEKHYSIAAEPGMAERTIIASGHSKGFAMTGWRLGFSVMPTAEEAIAFKTHAINNFSCVPPFIQEAGREAFENPQSDAAIEHMVSAFQGRRDWVVEALNSIDGVRCQNPKGAFYAFPNVAGMCENLGIMEAYNALSPQGKADASPSKMLQMFLMYSYGVATLDRNSFGRIGADGEHFLRLSLGTSLDLIKEGVERMEKASKDVSGFAEFMKKEKMWS